MRVRTNENDFVQAGRGCLPSREPDDTGTEVGVSNLSDDMMAETAEVMAQTLAMLPAHTMQAILVKALMLNGENVEPCDCLAGECGEAEWNLSVAALAVAQKHAREFRIQYVEGSLLREARSILEGKNSPDIDR